VCWPRSAPRCGGCWSREGQLRVEGRDDGVGGTRRAHITGLGRLEHRVSALGGRLVVDSPRRAARRVRALLPSSEGQDRADHPGGHDHRVPAPDREQRTVRDRGGRGRESVVHGGVREY
jgi:hypothetical protein